MSCQERIYGLDVVRSAAIFLVVLQHSWTMLDLGQAAGTIQHHFYSSIIYGVALFVMISGALNLRNVQPALQFYKKRYARILPPFLLWGTVTYVISSLTGRYDCVNDLSSGVRMYLPYLLTGKINDAYWFVYLIAAIYLITPLLQRLFCRDSRTSKTALPVAIVIWFALESFTTIPGRAGILVLYVGYYLCGAFFLKYVSHRNRRLTLAAGSLCFVGFFLYNVHLHSAGQASFIVECGEILSMFAVLSETNPHTRLFERISRYSYFIYLTHFIIIRSLYTFCPGVFPPVWYTPILTTILVIGLESVVCLFLDRMGNVPKRIAGI